MPIKGLTDKDQIQFGKGLPRIATIYKGDEKPKEGNRPGKDLEYFRIEFEPEFENLRPEWEDLYGEEPKEFPEVYLAQGTVEEAFATWKEEWNASQTLIHRCDGENQVSAYITSGPDTGYRTTALIPCATSCQCKPVGRLNLIFSDFIQITGVLGYITIATHSVHDIIGLHRALTDYYKIRTRTGNDLTGTPFVFGRAKREISAPKSDGKGGRTAQRMKVSKSLLYIRPTAAFTNAVILPALATPQINALPAPAQPAPVVTELRLSDGLKGNERRVTADRPLMVQSEGTSKKIDLDPEGKLVVLVDPAPEVKPEETPAPVVIESTAAPIEPEAPKADEPPTEVATAYDKKELNKAVEFLYKNGFEQTTSVNKLIKDGAIKPTYPLTAAVWAVLIHRAEKYLKFTLAEIVEALNFNTEQLIMKPTEWQGSYEDAYNKLVTWRDFHPVVDELPKASGE